MKDSATDNERLSRAASTDNERLSDAMKDSAMRCNERLSRAASTDNERLSDAMKDSAIDNERLSNRQHPSCYVYRVYRLC
jgi:hypothetical protein